MLGVYEGSRIRERKLGRPYASESAPDSLGYRHFSARELESAHIEGRGEQHVVAGENEMSGRSVGWLPPFGQHPRFSGVEIEHRDPGATASREAVPDGLVQSYVSAQHDQHSAATREHTWPGDVFVADALRVSTAGSDAVQTAGGCIIDAVVRAPIHPAEFLDVDNRRRRPASRGDLVQL